MKTKVVKLYVLPRPPCGRFRGSLLSEDTHTYIYIYTYIRIHRIREKGVRSPISTSLEEAEEAAAEAGRRGLEKLFGRKYGKLGRGHRSGPT